MDFGKLTLYRQGEQPQEVRLRLGSLSVGSNPTADISVDDNAVDAFHLRLVCTPAGCQLTDLGSRLGTMLNKERLAPNKPVRLQDGDRIRFGRAGLVYTAPRPAPATPPQPDAAAPAHRQKPAPEPATEPEPEARPVGETEPTPEARPRPQKEAVAAAGRAEQPPATGQADAADRGPALRPSGKPQPLTPPTDDWATFFAEAQPRPTDGVPATVLPSNRRRKLPRHEERGLPYEADDYLALLPPIYHDDRFLRRYLLIFKSILSPLDRQIAQISHYFDPRLAPEQLLPWLAGWVDLALDERWPEARRRDLVGSASVLYRWRGTRRGLHDYLRIYLGPEPEIRIVEQGQERRERGEAPLPPHTFRVVIRSAKPGEIDRGLVERILEFEKPAHTSFQLDLPGA